MDKLQMVDIDRMDGLNEVSKNAHYQIAMGFSESDAEGAIEAILDKYPGIVLKAVSKKYIRNLATLEAMNTLMKAWSV